VTFFPATSTVTEPFSTKTSFSVGSVQARRLRFLEIETRIVPVGKAKVFTLYFTAFAGAFATVLVPGDQDRLCRPGRRPPFRICTAGTLAPEIWISGDGLQADPLRIA